MKQPADETRLHLGDFFIISALATALTGALALHFAPDPGAQLQDWIVGAVAVAGKAARGARDLLALLVAALLAALAP